MLLSIKIRTITYQCSHLNIKQYFTRTPDFDHHPKTISFHTTSPMSGGYLGCSSARTHWSRCFCRICLLSSPTVPQFFWQNLHMVRPWCILTCAYSESLYLYDLPHSRQKKRGFSAKRNDPRKHHRYTLATKALKAGRMRMQ